MTGMEMRHCTCQGIGIYRQRRRREPGSMSSVHVARALCPGHLECWDEMRVISVQQIRLWNIFTPLDTARKERPFCVYIGGAKFDNESVLLLFYGDVQTARVGWRKQADAWESVEKLCTSGERKWNEYGPEEIHAGAALGTMLAAEELPLLREFHSHTFGGVALRDARVAEE